MLSKKSHLSCYILAITLKHHYKLNEFQIGVHLSEYYSMPISGQKVIDMLHKPPKRPILVQELLKMGYSQGGIAEILGISQSTVSYNSKKPCDPLSYVNSALAGLEQYYEDLERKNQEYNRIY